MDFEDLLRRRRMVRAYEPTPVPSDVLRKIVWAARRAPSAGNTDALDILLLSGAEEVSAYWAVTLPQERRASFKWRALVDAPALMVLWTRPEAYTDRYGEADKAAQGLGEAQERWPVPYWWVDAGGAALAMQLAAQDAGLGCLFFTVGDHENAVRARFGVPPDRRAVGALTFGYPVNDEPGLSVSRARRDPEDIVHRGTW
ncbi:MAG: nitroreductase family protein [Acidimicrobiales bacterium]